MTVSQLIEKLEWIAALEPELEVVINDSRDGYVSRREARVCITKDEFGTKVLGVF